jgi:hypothetical protein
MVDFNSSLIGQIVATNNYLIIHRGIALHLGFPAAIWISYMAYKWNYFKENDKLTEDGYFYFTQKDMEEEIGLSPFQQNQAIEEFKKHGIVNVKEMGMPKKKYYRLDIMKAVKLLEQFPQTLKNFGSRPEKTSGQDLKNLRYNNKEYKKEEKEISSPIGEDKGASNDEAPPTTSRLPRLTGKEMLHIGMDLPGMVPSIKPLPEPIVPPKEIQSLIDVWNTLGGVRHLNSRSNVYKEAVRKLKLLLRGKMFSVNHYPKYLARSFTIEEILKVFDSFKLALQDPKERKYLRGLSLPNFLFHSWNGRSMFLELFESPSNSVPRNYAAQLEADPRPEVTAIFKKFYVREVLGGVEVRFSVAQENKFRLATRKAMDFLKANQKRMTGLTSVRDYANLVCDALRDWVKGNVKELNVGNFPSDHTWNKVVPAYMAHVSVTESYSSEED